MITIQFGLNLPSELRARDGRDTYLADLNRCLDLIEGHFDSAWMVDHLQTGLEGEMESFTSIAYLAALHPRLKFGSAVLSQSFRNPALLAKMGATLQLLSGGRFILGLGAGWHAGEYKAYGYDFPSNRVRVEQLEETLQIIRALWTEDKVTLTGKFYRVQDAYCRPKPDPLPPIMVGAFKPKMLRLTARYADWWNVSSIGPLAYQSMAAEFDRACQEIGRDPASVRRTWIGGCACAATQQAAEDLAGDRFSAQDESDFGFVGTSRQIVEQMQRLIDLGIDTFILDCQDFPTLDGLQRLINEVLPAVKEMD